MAGSTWGKRKKAVVAAVAAGLVLFSLCGYLGYLSLSGPTPGKVTGVYISAMSRGDYEAAYRELSSASKASVGAPSGLRQTAIGAAFSNGVADSYSIAKTSKLADGAQVEVKLAKGQSEIVVNVVCVREGHRWRVEV